MTDETQIQPQELPKVQEPPQAQAPVQLQAVPALKGISAYFAMGAASNGGMPQLYAYDVTLGQWRVAQGNELEQMMISLGIPPNVLNALKTFRM